MQIAGQDVKFKRAVLLKQKRALQLSDKIREGLVALLTSEENAGLEELQKHWAEFAEIAIEGPALPIDGMAAEEVLAVLVGFTQRVSSLPK